MSEMEESLFDNLYREAMGKPKPKEFLLTVDAYVRLAQDPRAIQAAFCRADIDDAQMRSLFGVPIRIYHPPRNESA